MHQFSRQKHLLLKEEVIELGFWGFGVWSEVYAKDSLGRTAFHYAACSGGEDAGIWSLTIMASWDPEVVHITDNHGRTALHYAIFNANTRKVDVVRRLIELGCDVNAIDEDWKSALHHAAENGKAKVIPILV